MDEGAKKDGGGRGGTLGEDVGVTREVAGLTRV